MNSAENVFLNLAKVARADRILGSEEAEVLERYRVALGLGRREARRIISRLAKGVEVPSSASGQAGESLAHLRMLMRLASADSRVSRRETQLIGRVAESLGIGPIHLAEMSVEHTGRVKSRRKVRLATSIAAGAVLLAVAGALWSARSRNSESERSDERLVKMQVQLDAAARRRSQEALRRIAAAGSRFETEEARLKRRLAVVEAEVERAANKDRELKGLDAKLDALVGRGDPVALDEIRKLREELEGWRTGADDRARSRSELERLRLELDRAHGVRRTFQSAIDDCNESVLILAVQYGLKRGADKKRRGASGTGFFISPDGLMITNKHVLEPWKFDADDRADLDQGWVIDPSVYHIGAWRAGSQVFDEHHRYQHSEGFGTHDGKLRVVSTGPDRWVKRKAENAAGRWVEGRYHALDSSDLAMLSVNLAKEAAVFPLAPDEKALRPLDPVMVLGFPAGFGMIEGRKANTAPSLGQIRKIESSLWITAPIVGGNSGGPIIDGRGRVVAVANKGFQESDSLGAGIPIRHVLSLLPPAEDLLGRAERMAEKGRWRAAGSFHRLALARDPAIAPRALKLGRRLQAHFEKERRRADSLQAEGKADEASSLREVIDFQAAPIDQR